jgi:hypothetical protein
MSRPVEHERTLDEILERIRSLSPAARDEVARFLERISARPDPNRIESFEHICEPAFERIWDNPDDAAYDAS